MTAEVTFEALWSYVEEHFQCGPHSCHGVDHWKRVWRNGRVLAKRTGANESILELFALFHDSCRLSDGTDPGHGARGAELAKSLRGVMFDLPDEEFELLHFACTWHQDRDFVDDATVASCWDADRLDLGRVGIVPDPGLLNTEIARQLAWEPDLEAALRKYDQESTVPDQGRDR